MISTISNINMNSHLADMSYWVDILAFIVLAVGAILGPWLGSRKSIRDLNKPNGASKKIGIDTTTYADYNLYDLCLQSLLNSKSAMDDAAAAAALAGMARADVKKIVEHLGIGG